jgi:hypothetical protein
MCGVDPTRAGGIDRAFPEKRRRQVEWSSYQGGVCTDEVPPGPSFLGTALHITS